MAPDDWQQLVLRSWLGVRPDGQWAAIRCGLAVPRQNGKNGILEIRELFGMVVLGEKFLHTAHEVKTARKAFLRLASFFENRNYPELTALVSDIRKTNGQEAIVLRNGGQVEFVARSKNSARGFTADVLVIDEAQELSDEAIEALLPAISASPRGNPQQIYTGTPPGPKANGEIFTRVRTDGLEGKDKTLSWHEWSCLPDADLDDPRNLAAANPALGIRVNKDITDAERNTLSDDGFGRERLGMWDEVTGKQVIPRDWWSLVSDEHSAPVDSFALAVGVSPDRSSASVALAGRRADGLWHVELDEQRSGVGWVPAYVAERCAANRIRAVVVNGSSPASSVVEGLLAKKIRATTMNAQQVAQSFGQFYDAVKDAEVRHTGQHQVTGALQAAAKRPLAGAFAWSQKNSASDITPIEACTFALWGAQASKVRRPGGRSNGERSNGNRSATVS